MMEATFNGKPSSKIICYSPTKATDETDLEAFYNELFFLVCSIPKCNVLIIDENMNAQVDKKCKQQV